MLNIKIKTFFVNPKYCINIYWDTLRILFSWIQLEELNCVLIEVSLLKTYLFSYVLF